MKTQSLAVCLSLVIGTLGCAGPEGPAGPPGEAGPPGAKGEPGKDGSGAGLETGGTRIKPMTVTTGDGAVSRVGWWDAERDEECAFVRLHLTDATDEARCLPLDMNYLSAFYDGYTDPQCTTPMNGQAEPETYFVDRRYLSVWRATSQSFVGQLYAWEAGTCVTAGGCDMPGECFTAEDVAAEFAGGTVVHD